MKFNEDFIRHFMPYAFFKKENKWIATNREYDDIGNTGVNVSSNGFKFIIDDNVGIDRKMLEEISVYEKIYGNDVQAFYLYNDNCQPWFSEAYYDAYMLRLKKLLHYAK